MVDGKIMWGIVGAGSIVDRWMRGQLNVADSEAYAISSRRIESAKAAAEKWNIPNAVTFEEMINMPEIDIVYIAVPHQAHVDVAVEAMKKGKNVLCEKPAGANEAQLQAMLDCAKENNVFFMEAVWTRFFPVMQHAIKMIRDGELGDIRTVEANFSFRVGDGDTSRLTDVNRAGGGLLDTGVYNLHLAHMIYDKAPKSIIGSASFDTDEQHLQVDEQAAYVAQYDRGELAVLMSGIRTNTLHTAWIYGTKGYIEMPVFWKPTEMTVVIGEEKQKIEYKVPQNVPGVEDEGYQYEITYVNDCIRKGLKESDEITWAASLHVVQQMDELRRQWNFKYPFE